MTALLAPTDLFAPRHLGPRAKDVTAMLQAVGSASLEELVGEAIPDAIRSAAPLDLRGLRRDAPLGEREGLAWLKSIISNNEVRRSMIGMGYADCVVPPVIARNILENPGWYT